MRKNRVKKTYLIAGFLVLFAFIILVVTNNRQEEEKTDESESTRAPYSSATPLPTLAPIPTSVPYYAGMEDEQEFATQGSLYDGTTSSVHANSGEYSCNLISGATLTIGIESDMSDRIYLNPQITDPDGAVSQYGIYVRSSTGTISCNDTSGEFPSSTRNSAYKTLYILDRTYDTSVPAESLTWEFNPLDIDGLEGAVVNFRVIRFSDNCVLGTANAIIGYDEAADTYLISKISSSDVSDTGVIAAEERDALVSRAFDFIIDPDIGPDLGDDAENIYSGYISNIRNAVVEKTDKLYFGQLFSPDQELIKAGNYNGKDIYAVTVPFPVIGFATVYFMPQAQIDGFQAPTYPGESEIELNILGYDFLTPLSKDMLQGSEVAN